MKKIVIISLGAAAMLASALPAAAQSWDRPDYRGFQGGSIEQRIDRGVRDGSLTRWEASRLRGELQQIHQLEWRYGRDGVSSWESRDIDRRYDALTQRLRFERNDGDYRHGWYDHSDRDYGRSYGR